jgi:hypothetical protein
MALEPDEKERGQQTTGPAKGDFIAPPEVADTDERADALPQEEGSGDRLHASAACRSRKSRLAGTAGEVFASSFPKFSFRSKWWSAFPLGRAHALIKAI